MDYLRNHALHFGVLPKEKSITINPTFFTKGKDSVIENNPVPAIDIEKYLEFDTKGIPVTWNEFSERVSRKNIECLLGMIKNYGYLSNKRVRLYSNDDFNAVSVYINAAPKEYKKDLWEVVKKEYKIGNMDEGEYLINEYMLGKGPRDFELFLRKYKRRTGKDLQIILDKQ
ncbi:hypothetical protein [Flavobacterium rhizosphaerae]